MIASCSEPIAWEDLVSYWAGDLAPGDAERVEMHLMGCGGCSAASERVAAITESLRVMTPAFLSREGLAKLRARGVRVVDNPVVATDVKTAVFPLGVDVLLHRLRGLDLSRAQTIEVKVIEEDTGRTLLVDPYVPFDAKAGEILVACQRHFGEISRTIVFEVTTRDTSGGVNVSRFAIPHLFEKTGSP